MLNLDPYITIVVRGLGAWALDRYLRPEFQWKEKKKESFEGKDGVSANVGARGTVSERLLVSVEM